jgi:hypothetical protein
MRAGFFWHCRQEPVIEWGVISGTIFLAMIWRTDARSVHLPKSTFVFLQFTDSPCFAAVVCVRQQTVYWRVSWAATWCTTASRPCQPRVLILLSALTILCKHS